MAGPSSSTGVAVDDTQYNQLVGRVNKLTERLRLHATEIAMINAKSQRSLAPTGAMTANQVLDVPITWPNAWPDNDYGVWIALTASETALSNVFATLKAGSKTTTGCIVTVKTLVNIALSVIVDVHGERTVTGF